MTNKFRDIKEFEKEAFKYLASNDDEAEARYSNYGKVDPFPQIVPSLLNSADVYQYVEKTGMICPFYPENLKSATYEVKVGGTCTYWDSEGKKHVVSLSEDAGFKLEKNSIAYVELEPVFRVPSYIALRFNLKIKHIYKGLLLGTGPIIDPGFNGKIFIPLHNLTNNTYYFKGDDILIELEFTKLSPNKDWSGKTQNGIKGVYLPFKGNRIDKDVGYYIDKALKGYLNDPAKGSQNDYLSVVNNSVPVELDEQKKHIDGFRKKIGIFQWGAVIAIVGIMVPVYFSIYVLYQSIDSRYDNLSQAIYENNSSVVIDSKNIETDLVKKIDDLRRENQKLKESLEDLDAKLNSLIELSEDSDNEKKED